MNTKTSSAPKSGAERKRAHDERKKAAGLIYWQVWVSPEERESLQRSLTRLRNKAKKLSKSA